MSHAATIAAMWPYRWWAAVRRTCGWPGLIGLALLVGAAVDIVRINRFVQLPASLPVVGAVTSHPAASAPAPALALVEEDGLPMLQRSIAERATADGLAWSAADYRVLSATDNLPPAYEVHCTLNGNYPAIRRFMVQTLAGAPSASLREFDMTRPSSDSAQVQAHLTFAFFLRPGATPSVATHAASEVRP